MRKIIFLFLISLFLFPLFCYSLDNPLIGTWITYKIQDPNGKIYNNLEEKGFISVFDKTTWYEYRNFKLSKTFKYTLHNDHLGMYIKVRDDGKLYGQLFTIIDSNTIRWDLFEPGTNRPAKSWMKRYK